MALYQPVLVYDQEGNFIGHAIKSTSALKLQSTNIYLEGEQEDLNAQLARLNESVSLKAVWPNPRDPEVIALLDDPKFMPIEYVEEDVVDDENSYYVYDKEPDPETGELGVINREASVIAYKTMMVPARPSDAMERQKGACEAVAKRRAEIA